MSGHSLLAPSAAARWMNCPGSISLSHGAPGRSTIHTATGTVAHWLGEQALRSGKDCAHWVGETRTILGDDASERWEIAIDEEMASYVQVYVDYVRRRYDEAPGALLIEHSVDLSAVLGVAGQGGTADAVLADVLISGRLEVVDLKYGYGEVASEDNEQLMLYALGALHHFDETGDVFNEIVVTICQPRLDSISSHTLTPGELRAFGDRAREAALKAEAALALGGDDLLPFLHPGESQCQWCPAKATCPALARQVIDVVFPDLDEPTPESAPAPVPDDGEALAANAALVPLIEGWCKAIMAEVQARAERGEMPGWKLVAGRRGARKWVDETAVEKMLKSFRLKKEQMYDFKLISPTTAEKRVTPARWEKLLELIEQPDGAPKAVPLSDKRPALPVGDVGFTDTTIEDLL